ncbi:P-loop NTPase family protein [Crocosphaera chwakensis]|uniref:CobQ/CobB/MinD/ParA nucleotide binding domain-containing protein n=1 Tax=Crocosphaera chwakensis CCY0110 TaxID=391612 RepID=A3IXC9_9CHRO|nr:hypothetical protein [Crocosphaera chwakensis]EAZ88872.1 hypothetical protein CY0110_31300 [Crocosphaera chwakensis CCY0110]
MKGLHFFTGEKGGVGKSLTAQTVVEYCQEKKIEYKLFDADRTSPDVGEIYEPSIYLNGGKSGYQPNNKSNGNRIYFSEEAEDIFLADNLFALACEQLVLVNLPAQVSVIVDAWLARGILELAEQEKVDIYFWFITDGSPESINLLSNFLSTYKDSNIVKTILVVNEGLSKQAIENINNSSIAKTVKSQTTATIKMPLLFLSSQEKKLLKEKRISLLSASKRENKEVLNIIAKQRVIQFLRNVHEQIDSHNIFESKVEAKTN